MNLPCNTLVRRCKLCQITFSKPTETFALDLLFPQCIKLYHLRSLLLYHNLVGASGHFRRISTGRHCGESIIQVTHDKEVGRVVDLCRCRERVGGVEEEVREDHMILGITTCDIVIMGVQMCADKPAL